MAPWYRIFLQTRMIFCVMYEAPNFTRAGTNFRIFQFSHKNNYYWIPRYYSVTTALRVLSTTRQHYTLSLSFKQELHFCEELIGCTWERNTHQFSEKLIPLDYVKFLRQCPFLNIRIYREIYFHIIHKLLGADIC